MVNGTLLNFPKRYEDDLRVIFDQWQKLHLGLDALSNQKILKGIYCLWCDDVDIIFMLYTVIPRLLKPGIVWVKKYKKQFYLPSILPETNKRHEKTC